MAAPGLEGAILLALNAGRLRTFQVGDTALTLIGGAVATGEAPEQEPVEVVFGRDNSADASAPLSDNRSIVDRITTTAEGTVVNIIAWFSAAQAATGQWKGVIFADNGSNLPGNILYSTPAQTGGPSRQVATFSSAIVLPAGNYWIGIVTSGMYTNVQSQSNTGVAPNTQLSNANNFTTPVNWTNPSTANYATELSCALTLLVGGALPESPINSVAPAISGTLMVGNVLSCTTGTWSGTPTPTYTYQWYRDATPISGATANTYTTVNADAGANITCTVTATNTAGVQGATSNTLVPTRAPLTNVSPLITGGAGVGSMLSVSNGTWYAYPVPTYSYQWKRDGVNISGATSSTYTTQDPADVDTDITCDVTATNTHGSATQASSNAITVTAGSSTGMFGTTTTGGASYPTNDDRVWVGKYVLTDNASLTNFNIWRPTASTFAEIKGLIFADVAGTPGALVASTAMVSIPSGGPGFYTIPITGTLAPGTYWVGVVTGGAYVNLTGQATGDTLRGEAYNYPAWDAAWPGGGSAYTGALSVNVEYDIVVPNQVFQITPATLSNGYIGTGTVTFSNAYATALTPGNSVVVYTNVYHNTNAVPTAVTIGGASATKVSEQLVASNNTSAQVWIATVPSSPNRDITITVASGSDSYPTVAGLECSPLAASPVDFDNVVPISSATNPSITGESATSQASMLLLSQWGPLYGSSNLGSSGPSAGWTELSLQQDSSTYQGGAMAYRVTTAIETPTCSWTRTPSGDWFASVVALKFA